MVWTDLFKYTQIYFPWPWAERERVDSIADTQTRIAGQISPLVWWLRAEIQNALDLAILGVNEQPTN